MTLAMRSQRTRSPLPPRRAGPAVEIVVESALWKEQRNAKALLRRAIAEAGAKVPECEGELAIVLTDDAAMRTLNRDWRCKDAATNVCRFRHRDRAPRLESPACSAIS